MPTPDSHPSESSQPKQKSFKLDQAGKSNIFSVPKEYFDALPSIIQARAVKPAKARVFFFGGLGTAVSFGSVAAVCLAIWLFNYYQSSQPTTPEIALAAVDSQAIVTYLEESDLNQTELIDWASGEGVTVDHAWLEQLNVPEDQLLENAETSEIEDFT